MIRASFVSGIADGGYTAEEVLLYFSGARWKEEAKGKAALARGRDFRGTLCPITVPYTAKSLMS